MGLSIKRTNIEDADVLLEIQKRAFQEDLEKYKDEKNPANESLSRLKEKIGVYIYFTLYLDAIIIGGADIRQIGTAHYRLNRLYIDPHHQNKGLGYKSIKLIEEQLSDATTWELDTPHLSYRNHHLYEKLGYKQVGEHKISEYLTLLDYVKSL